MAITDLERIQKAIATSKIKKLISDRPDLHRDIKIELYKSGMTYRAIAELFTINGVRTTHQTVARVITRAGINRTQAPQNHAPMKSKTLEKEQEIIDLRNQGFTQAEISSQLGICRQSISQVLKVNGLNTRQGYKDRWAKHRAMEVKAIAEEVGISPRTVQKVLAAKNKK